MTFPEEILDLEVELRISGVWTNISEDVRGANTIRIKRGRSSEEGEVPPSTCSLTLENPAGKYSPRHPLSLYFGLIGRNTPIRVSVNAGEAYLRLEDRTGDRASTPDAAALDITGNIDLRADVRMDNPASTLASRIVGKWDGSTQKSYLLSIQSNKPFLAWSEDGSTTIELGATTTLPVFPSRRIAVRVTLDVDNGAAGNTLTFYWAETIAGPWTQLGDPVVTPGTTSIFSGTAPLDVGALTTGPLGAPPGEILAAEVQNGIDGTVVANPDFTAQVVGATSFADASGLTWTLAGDASISNKRIRFNGEVSEWPGKWDTGGFDPTVDIEASGITRRLTQGTSPLQSTLRRRIPSGEPLAYWPLEDGSATISPASPIDGVRPLEVSDFSFASDDSLGGSDALPTLGSAGRLYGRIPGAVAGGWHVEFVFNLETMPTVEGTMLRLYLSGAGSGVVAVRVRCSTSGIRVQALDEDNAVVAFFLFTDADAIADFTGEWNRLQLFSYDDGPQTFFAARWINITDTGFWRASTVFSGAPGRLTAVRGAWGTDFSGMGIGHLAAWDAQATSTDDPGITIYGGADDGFAGESANNRMLRIVNEESPAISMFILDGDPTVFSELVGPQRVISMLEIIRSAAEVDGGVLYEQREDRRLIYRDRSTLYNQTVKLTLDYTGDDGLVAPLDPVDDDQATRNDVTVTRDGGSFGRFELEEGPLSVQTPPDGVGRYDDSVNLNIYRDEQADEQAAHRVHLGTVDETRYPLVKILLANAVHMITDAAEVELGDRIQITNPPAWLPPDTIDLIVQGYEETFSQYQWDIDFTCTPALPWDIGIVEDEVFAHVDTDGSELTEALTTTQTDVDVTAFKGSDWVTGEATYTGETATAFDVANALNYLVSTDADAADITVGDEVRIFDIHGNLKEFTTFTITAKNSAFGFTNNEFTPNAEVVTVDGDQIRVGTFTGTEFPFDVRVGGEVMTVSAIADSTPAVTDAFSRTDTDTWTVADTGQTWTNTGGVAADYDVLTGFGRHINQAVSTGHHSTVVAPNAASDIYLDITTAVLSTGASQFAGILARHIDLDNLYEARVEFTTANAITLSVRSRVTGTETELGTYDSGITHVAATFVRVRFRTSGTSLRAKIWAASGAEPLVWHIEVTDSSLTASGGVGAKSVRNSGNTNANAEFRFDNFEVDDRQTFTVIRSVNTLVKAHTAGTDVRLAHPAIVSL